MNGNNGGKKVKIGVSQMRRLARYELAFNDITRSNDTAELVFSNDFVFELEDLHAALINIKEKNPESDELFDNWIYLLTNIEEFGIKRARGLSDIMLEAPDEPREYPVLLLSDSDWFDYIWYELERRGRIYDDEAYDLEADEPEERTEAEEETISVSRITDVVDIDGMITDLERYLSNRGKPVIEWEFADREKHEYLNFYEDEDEIKGASEKELALCRRFTEELCEKDDTLALHMKGYSCYGGDRLYPCDWNASRDCISRLFELTDNAQYANTLGYIYYYGRCTGGEPEYDKAFYYFGISAANGLYEGMYKLADMFYHGWGCKKSPRTARRLYGMVYEDTLKKYLEGERNSFPDAALRMGNVYAKGIDCEPDFGDAYHYYLQANYAACKRAEDSDFFGNTTVVMNVKKALEETASKLPEGYFRDYCDYGIPIQIVKLAEKNDKLTLKKERTADGVLKLTAEGVPSKKQKKPKPILFTDARINYCKLINVVTLDIVGEQEVCFANDADEACFDYCEWNRYEDRFEFYLNDEIVAWIRCDAYRMYAEKEDASGEKLRLVSVKFGVSGRKYDYLCDFDVNIGEKVIVGSYSGETEVTVVDVFEKYESELGLPKERYIKILRKA